MADFDTFNAYVVEPLRLTRTWRTLRSEVDAGGLGLRRQKWQNPVTEFEVTLSFPDGVASAAFLAFFDAKRGGRSSFTWTCPRDSVVYTCVFSTDGLTESWEGPESYDYTVTLRGTA